MAVLAVVAILAVWQITKIHSQNRNLKETSNTINTLEKSNRNLSSKNSTQAKELTQETQEIAQLSQNGTFVSGSPCQTQQLSLNPVQSEGAAGTDYEFFDYKNTSASTCTVDGYPGFLSLSSSGYVVPDGPVTRVKVGNDDGPTKISLAPSAVAYFAASWNSGGVVPNEQCIQPSLIESTPPGNYIPLILTVNNINGLNNICNYNVNISALAPMSVFDGLIH